MGSRYQGCWIIIQQTPCLADNYHPGSLLPPCPQARVWPCPTLWPALCATNLNSLHWNATFVQSKFPGIHDLDWRMYQVLWVKSSYCAPLGKRVETGMYQKVQIIWNVLFFLFHNKTQNLWPVVRPSYLRVTHLIDELVMSSVLAGDSPAGAGGHEGGSLSVCAVFPAQLRHRQPLRSDVPQESCQSCEKLSFVPCLYSELGWGLLGSSSIILLCLFSLTGWYQQFSLLFMYNFSLSTVLLTPKIDWL